MWTAWSTGVVFFLLEVPAVDFFLFLPKVPGFISVFCASPLQHWYRTFYQTVYSFFEINANASCPSNNELAECAKDVRVCLGCHRLSLIKVQWWCEVIDKLTTSQYDGGGLGWLLLQPVNAIMIGLFHPCHPWPVTQFKRNLVEATNRDSGSLCDVCGKNRG